MMAQLHYVVDVIVHVIVVLMHHHVNIVILLPIRMLICLWGLAIVCVIMPTISSPARVYANLAITLVRLA